MPTDNLWQFRFTELYGDYGRAVDTLGNNAPIHLESFPYPEVEIPTIKGLVSISRPCAILKFKMVTDATHTLTGKVRVLCSANKFVRDPLDFNIDLLDLSDHEFDLDVNDVTQEYTLVIESQASTMLYVSVAYETDQSLWLFSASNLMDRVLIRDSIGLWGDRLFSSLPMYQQTEDQNHDDALFRLLKLFGIAFDDAYSRANLPHSLYDYERVDAAHLPFIDRLIGWPTNFELPENLRRRETGQAVDLWKTKGSARALELVMQRTIGWDVEIFEGWRHVARTAIRTPSQPNDWIEGQTDPNSTLDADLQFTGVWDSLSPNQLMTWSPRDSTTFTSANSSVLVLPSPDKDWKNVNGVLIRLYPSQDAKVTLTRLALTKARNLLPLFVLHSADVYFLILDVHQETLNIGLTVEFDDDFGSRHANDIRLDILDHFSNTKSNKCLFKTWSVFEAENSETNDEKYRLHHSHIEFLCDSSNQLDQTP